jgi:predicted ester cyclase
VSTEENKALIRRFIADVWNRGNLASVEELVAQDAMAGGRVVGPDAVRAAIARQAEAFPDGSNTIEDLVAEGDRVVLRGTFRGTHTGTLQHPVFGQIAPTGKQLTISGTSIFRLAAGKIVERWQLSDDFGYGQQLGVLPTPQQGPT